MARSSRKQLKCGRVVLLPEIQPPPSNTNAQRVAAACIVGLGVAERVAISPLGRATRRQHAAYNPIYDDTFSWIIQVVPPSRAVRTLCFGGHPMAKHHQAYAWQPVLDVGAETSIAVLASLFWKHGSPLVLKRDNGSAFIAGDTGDLLAAWGILHLRNRRTTA